MGKQNICGVTHRTVKLDPSKDWQVLTMLIDRFKVLELPIDLKQWQDGWMKPTVRVGSGEAKLTGHAEIKRNHYQGCLFGELCKEFDDKGNYVGLTLKTFSPSPYSRNLDETIGNGNIACNVNPVIDDVIERFQI